MTTQLDDARFADSLREAAETAWVPRLNVDLERAVRRGHAVRRRRTALPLAAAVLATVTAVMLPQELSGTPVRPDPRGENSSTGSLEGGTTLGPTLPNDGTADPAVPTVPDGYLETLTALADVVNAYPGVAGELRWNADQQAFELGVTEGAADAGPFRAAVNGLALPDGYGVHLLASSSYSKADLVAAAERAINTMPDWVPTALGGTLYGISTPADEGRLVVDVDEANLAEWQTLLSITDLGVPAVARPVSGEITLE